MPRLGLARALVGRYLTDTCAIHRAGPPVDDEVGSSTPGPDVVSAAPCAVSRRDVNATEPLVAGASRGVALFTLHFPAATDVQHADRVVLTPEAGGPDRLFQIVGGGGETIEAVRRVVAVEVT